MSMKYCCSAERVVRPGLHLPYGLVGRLTKALAYTGTILRNNCTGLCEMEEEEALAS